MNTTFGFHDSHIHDLGHDNGFEWWYLDSLLNEDVNLVIIFFRANPLSPDAVPGSRANPSPAPPAMVVSVRTSSRSLFYLFRQYRPGEIHVRDSADGVTFDVPEGRFTIDSKKRTASVDLKCWNKLRTRSLDVTGLVSARSLTSPKMTPPASDGHTWNLLAPRCDLIGHCDILRWNRPLLSLPLAGSAYLDHNYSSVPLYSDETPWYWGRLHSDSFTAVYYVYRELGRPSLLWIWDDNELIAEEAPLSRTVHRSSVITMGLHYDSDYTMEGSTWTLRVRSHSILDYGPFYLRFLSTMELRRSNTRISSGIGITEFMHPNRIGWKMFHPFVNMKITRPRSIRSARKES